MPRLTAKQQIKRGGVTIEPGESFEVRGSGEARALKALGRAVDYVDPAAFHQQQHDAQRDALRAKAEALGVDIDRRWGVDRLTEEIAAAEAKVSAQSDEEQPASAGRHYQRRDMQVKE